MSQESSTVDQAISRAMRDSLAALQRGADDLRQAMEDLVSAAGSSRPMNALSPALRAQTAAAALSAALDVMARFIATAAQPAARVLVEQAVTAVAPAAAPQPVRATEPPIPAPMEVAPAPVVEIPPPAPEVAEPLPPSPPLPPPVVEPAPAAVEARVEVTHEPPPPPPPVMEEVPAAAETAPVMQAASEAAAEAISHPVAPLPPPPFDVSALPPEMQEIHRRANRAAKVSMQDIKLLKPKDVQAGRENKDICKRLKDDIDKARKEYDRRFKAILDQPVDYFYQWLVDILADGNAEALGNYPYPSPILRR
jgi:hypothetical protein